MTTCDPLDHKWIEKKGNDMTSGKEENRIMPSPQPSMTPHHSEAYIITVPRLWSTGSQADSTLMTLSRHPMHPCEDWVAYHG